MTSRSERAVTVLNQADPQFNALCELLYGPGVDADAIWGDVYGLEPISKLSEGKKHAIETLGLGATLVGGGLGVKELAEQAGKIGKPGNLAARGAEKLNSIVPKRVANNAKLRTGLAGGMLAGDAAATATLEGQRQQRKTANGTLVAKNTPATVMREATEHAEGLISGADKAEKLATRLVRLRARPLHSAKEIPGKVVDAAKANPGKATAIGAGVVGAGAVAHDARRPRTQVPQEELVKRLEEPMEEFEAAGTFSKFDEDKRLAFGWASVVSKNGVPVVDRQGDYMTIDDVEDAAYRYVISSRIGGDMHKRNGESPHHVSDLVESMVFTKEKIAKMGLPDDFPEAWWVGFKVHDDDTWNLVKSDKRTGFSIHGSGKRAMHDLDDAMGYV